MPWKLNILLIFRAPWCYYRHRKRGRRRRGRRRKQSSSCDEAASSSLTESIIYSDLSSNSSVPNKDSVVRIVLASGLVEVYDDPVPAHSITQKYPGLCLARPEVFRAPHESLVGHKETLYPGEKFYLVPETTVKKLQRKFQKKEVKGLSKDEAAAPSREVVVVAPLSEKVVEEESCSGVCSAKDFYVENDKWKKCFVKRFMKGGEHRGEEEEEEKKQSWFVAPVMRTRTMRQGSLGGWKPGLSSVEEE